MGKWIRGRSINPITDGSETGLQAKLVCADNEDVWI